ncbi:YkgJ family cysteine cluster protein [Dyella acidiphila]|uniref:YkgJ family cysteine cluster protein n=1 Tax=Dyella acidiphila TaxID=2775866 RepID=A0ABR9GA34_9GAMM|nr:YkgJ family cysteine cluster protein [Dyella acidiphila]MBE1160918.1 YkgJ family cysteine cluster protein [Dyella acidiphila]
MTNLNFNCVQCGKCCHDLKLPLTHAEAIAWLRRGGTVEVLCEAIPWVTEPDAADAQATHKRQRSFPTQSGNLSIRVIVVLAAGFAGPCPYLTEERRCGIYVDRPHVCRIYPAEVNPFIALAPTSKKCPPEAWESSMPFMRDNKIVDAQIQLHTTLLRHEDQLDVPLKARACQLLGIQSASIANEGFMLHRPSNATLLAALEASLIDSDAPGSDWELATNQSATLSVLHQVGARPVYIASNAEGASQYLGFRPDSPPDAAIA